MKCNLGKYILKKSKIHLTDLYRTFGEPLPGVCHIPIPIGKRNIQLSPSRLDAGPGLLGKDCDDRAADMRRTEFHPERYEAKAGPSLPLRAAQGQPQDGKLYGFSASGVKGI